jgi:hypothetical protein
MIRAGKALLVVFVFLSVACNLASQPLPATQPPIPTQTAPQAPAPPLATSTLAASATQTETPAPTDTATTAATTDPLSATMAAMFGSMGAIGSISQYFHPAGAPVESWHDVPIMPQATAGQEYPGNIYSYVATATLDQAWQFYTARATALGFLMAPGTGYGGTGSSANHSVTFISFDLTIVLTSMDDDTGHVIVVISKTS